MASPTALPIYAEMVGPLKAIGYVEEGRLGPAQIALVRQMGNDTDGKFVWNRDALARLLALNEHVVGVTGIASVDGFVNLVRSREPIDDPNLLCLVHAAFLDHETFVADDCRATALLLPADVATYLDAVTEYGPDLTPEEAWVVPLTSPAAGWPRLFAALNGLKRQVIDCRRALFAGRP